VARIGVFVCHCGVNIAATVDVVAVAEAARHMPHVVFATDYKYMCSDPGQKEIQDAIREHNLTGVVVSACSPRMHTPTFQRAVAAAGVNPYLMEMANIREQCSWVHPDKAEGTEKAIDTVRMLVAKVAENTPLTRIGVPITQRALVIGGGIAGIQAALDIAEGGKEVILLERSPSIGGHMAGLDETFPTLDCSQCILTPKMVDAYQHPKIKLHTYCELESLEGYIGNFKATIRQKARSVDPSLCNGCGTCAEKCPQKKILSEFDQGTGFRTAIYFPFPQAVPKIPVIDKETCTYYKTGKCKVCEKVCPTGAIKFDQEDELHTEEVGAIVVATGFKTYPISDLADYGYGRYPDVINGLQFERLVSASGPTGGKLLRPSDKTEPKTVVMVCCVGSRDEKVGRPYCSRICCMYTAKHAILLHHRVHDAKCYVFYMDIRAAGKMYDEFTRRAMEKEGAVYLRGRVTKVYEENGKLIVRGADTLSGTQVEIAADLVVLATGITAQPDSPELARKLSISYDSYGFFNEAHPKLRPVETNTAGIFLAGACQSPKDIPDCVAMASGAASKVLGLLSNDIYQREPLVAKVDPATCVACYTCEAVCPYGAIERSEVPDYMYGQKIMRPVAKVNEGKCMGCGTCVASCRSNSIDLAGFSDKQIYAELEALLAGGEKK
jgi:heterodisulfide reductase subunit A2